MKTPLNELVKIIRSDDGDLTENDSWHLVDPTNDQGPAALCTQEFFGFGESMVEFETKTAKRGGVTCPECLKKIRLMKAVKL